MATIEFQTYIDHGTIELPEELRDRVKGHARVIILADDNDEEDDFIDFLLDHPYTIETFAPLTRDDLYERR